jgi:hypothetical protein
VIYPSADIGHWNRLMISTLEFLKIIQKTEEVLNELKQDRQCTYKANWATFMQLLLPWKSNNYCTLRMCDCNHMHPPCNAHAPYCHLWPARLCNISTLSRKRHDFRRKILLRIKCAFWFTLQLLSETLLILRRNEQDMILKNVRWCSCKVAINFVRF